MTQRIPFLCQVLGHKLDRTPHGNVSYYGQVNIGVIDGVGREHCEVRYLCDRCGQQWTAARFHMPNERKQLNLGVLIAVVEAAGGEVRVPARVLQDLPYYRIQQRQDWSKDEIVFTVNKEGY